MLPVASVRFRSTADIWFSDSFAPRAHSLRRVARARPLPLAFS